LLTVPTPSMPSPKYALIKVLRAGICNTDLEILRGYMGFKGVLGHEFVGRVEVRKEWLDVRVCGDINLGCCNSVNPPTCGVCDDSLGYDGVHSNMSRNHCPNRTVLGILNHDGTFAEYMILPITNLHKVPDGMSNEVAVFSEPLAAACRVLEQGLRHMARGGDRVAILGDGKLGLCVAEICGREYLRLAPILFGKHQHKLDFVANSGVETRLVSTCYDDDEQLTVSSNHSNKYDVVIDATGNPNGLTLAMSLCRPMGTLVLKSTCAAGVKGFHSAPIVIDELKVVGSRCGPIEKAIELLEGNDTGKDGVPPLKMEKYLTKTFPLSQARKALECAATKSTMKVQLV
ncbi:alcohol dehydrogenase, partial [Thalassiosira pseudonana CCMP1335]